MIVYWFNYFIFTLTSSAFRCRIALSISYFAVQKSRTNIYYTVATKPDVGTLKIWGSFYGEQNCLRNMSGREKRFTDIALTSFASTSWMRPKQITMTTKTYIDHRDDIGAIPPEIVSGIIKAEKRKQAKHKSKTADNETVVSRRRKMLLLLGINNSGVDDWLLSSAWL